MVRRSWQAALIAAAVVLAANVVRAEDKPTKGSCPKPCACPGVCTFPAYLSQFIGYGVADECCEQAKGACQDCCKDGKCCAGTKCSCKDGCKCEGGCKCCKDGCKCQGGCKCKDCCKAKAKNKTTCAAGCCCCCNCAAGKRAKQPAMTGTVIVVVPMGMIPPMPVCAAGACGPPAIVPPMPAPPVPPQTVGMPLPPPPMCYGCPTNGPSMPICTTVPAPVADSSGMNLDTCLSLLGLVADVFGTSSQPPSLPSLCMSALGLAMDLCGEMSAPPPAPCYPQHPPAYVPPPPPPMPESRPIAVLPPPLPDSPYCPVSSAPLPPPLVPCISAATPAPYIVSTPSTAAPQIMSRIVASSDGNRLEMCLSDDGRMSCKKMTFKVSDCALTLTCRDNKVRVRGDDLWAKADCVRTDRKDRLILEGGVVLHYKKDAQHASITAERIELNPGTGSMTIKSAGTIERIGVNVP